MRRTTPTAAGRELGPATGREPSGAPWDLPIEECPFAFVDLEMTGLDPATDRVIEICIERVCGDTLDGRLSSLVRVERLGGEQFHGIRPEDLVNAPAFTELAPTVDSLLGGAILVAHAAHHDVAFLRAEFGRLGRELGVVHYLDTLVLSRRAFHLPSHRLVRLAEIFGLSSPRAHRADNDVAVMRQLWPLLLADLKPRTARDLWHVRVGQRHARPEVVAEAVAAVAHPGPVWIHYRPSGRAQERILFRVTRVRTDLDPPIVLGYLHTTRGRRELRADRILAIEAPGGA